ncbi:hypothetical protein Q3G72_031786 [Acer saccharum]|nr:hypothetical protein Q3G72_031786 [Acer saccharum]
MHCLLLLLALELRLLDKFQKTDSCGCVVVVVCLWLWVCGCVGVGVGVVAYLASVPLVSARSQQNDHFLDQELKSPATASTSVAQYHDGSDGDPRLTTRPALAEIGTICLLTNSVEFQLSKLLLDLDILISSRNRFFHPFWLRQRLLLRPDFHGVLIAGLEINEIGEARRLGGQSGMESGEGLRELRWLSRGLDG